MRLFCTNCLAKYKVADENLKGKIFKFRCRKCDAIIVIDNFTVRIIPPEISTCSEKLPLDKAFLEAILRAQTLPDDIRLLAAVKPPPSTPLSDTTQPFWTVPVDRAPFFVLVEREPKGPFSAAAISEDYHAGLLDDHTLVWKEGLKGWIPFSHVKGLIALLSILAELTESKGISEQPAPSAEDRSAAGSDQAEPDEEALTETSTDRAAVPETENEDILIEEDEGKMIQAFDQMRGIYGAKTHDEAAIFSLNLACAIIQCEAGIGVLLSPGTHRFYVASATGIEPAPLGQSYSPSQGLLGHLAQSKQPFQINEPETDERFDKEIERWDTLTTRDILSAPLEHHGQMIGALLLLNSKNGFGSDDAEALSYIAKKTAEFIEVSLPERDGFREEDFSST